MPAIATTRAPSVAAPSRAEAARAISPSPAPLRGGLSASFQPARPALRLGPDLPAPDSSVRRLGAAGPGEPLPRAMQRRLEHGLDVDLSPVRVHRDAPAAGAVAGINARAFTVGRHIFLGAGESASDLGLMAHEAAHVVQQQSGMALQTFTTGSAHAHERDAEQAASAIERGETAVVQTRTPSPRPQPLFGWARRAVSAVAGVAGEVVGRAVEFIRARARSIPGYDLLGFILGRDPLTQQPVERNPTNLVRGLLGMIPGGAAMFENLQRAQVLQRAFGWISGELTRLNLTWPVIRGAIGRLLDSLGPADLLNLGGVFDRARAIFGPIVRSVATFAVEAGQKVLELIFEGALALAGSAGQQVLALFRRIGATFRIIINDPVAFLRNLISAVFGGFRQFGANILAHLRTAIFDWLFGALGDAGIQLPTRFDLRGIISIVLQILGLTYTRLRERLVRLIGEPAVRTVEQAFDFLRTLVTQGLAAAWQRILEFATGVTDAVIDGIKAWVARTIIGQAIARLVTMFNPVGAIINAIMTIYNTVMFVIERARQIMAFVNSVVDSIANIAVGNLSAAMNYVERTLARILPLVISFLARMIGLGGISARIREIIQRIRAPMDRALDRIAAWVTTQTRHLASRALGGNPSGPPQERLRQGMDAAVSAVNRLGGSRLGAAVLRPVLFAIKTRFAMQSLEAVQRGDRWAIAGRVNPAEERPTEKLVEGTGYRAFRTRVTYHGADARRGGTKMVADPLGPDHPTGSRPSEAGAPPIWSSVNQRRNGRRLYVLGHLLNQQLGGTGDDRRNLTPITFSANASHHARVEGRLKELINTARRDRARWVRYEVEVHYPTSRAATPADVGEQEGWLATHLTAKWRLLRPSASNPSQLEPDGAEQGPIRVDNIAAGFPQS